MADQKDRVVIVDDLVEYAACLRNLLLKTWPRAGLSVDLLSHKAAFDRSDAAWHEVVAGRLSAVLVDAHDLSRERQWDKGERALPFPLAGADVGQRILRLPDPPRLILYSDEIDNPVVNVALREATNSSAAGYYTYAALLKPGVLSSAIFDPHPIGQYPAPTVEDLAVYRGAWTSAHQAQVKAPEVFNLLVGGEEAIRAVRELPKTARDTMRKRIHRLPDGSGGPQLNFRRWDELLHRMQAAVGLRGRRD